MSPRNTGSVPKNAARLLVYAAMISSAAMTAEASLSFNLSNTPTAKGDTSTGIYAPLDIYSEPGGFGIAFLLPPVPLSLPPVGGGNTGTFMSTLTGTFGNGWAFSAAANSLALQVNADQVAGGSHNPCYQSVGKVNPVPDCVGIFGTPNTSGFAVSYTGPAIANGHWIQTLSTNTPAQGQTSPYVDNNKNAANPYYDSVYAANATTFLDAPNRSPTVSQYWIANLYYASGPNTAGTVANPSAVTIYNGLTWGWADIFVNVNNFAAFRAGINGDLATVASLDGALGTDLSSFLTQTSVNQLDSEFISETTPEPAMWLPLAAGMLGLVWRCNSQRVARLKARC
jgi:hypothetical protein